MMLNRRNFIIAMLAASAQASGAPLGKRVRVRRIGVVFNFHKDAPEAIRRIEAFESELKEKGWQEGYNLQIDYRFAAGNPDELAHSSSELIRAQVEVLVSNSYQPIAGVVAQNPGIPFVLWGTLPDPLQEEVLKGGSQSRSNVTGFNTFEFAITGKWVEVLKAVAPRVARAALLFNPDAYNRTLSHWRFWLKELEAACYAFMLDPIALEVRSAEELHTAIRRLPADCGLLAPPDAFTVGNYRRIVAAALERKLPACFPYRYFATEGGLMSYGPNGVHMFRQAAAYVDRILRGAKPSELPVQRPANFELVVNLKTARALELELPQVLLVRADELIE